MTEMFGNNEPGQDAEPPVELAGIDDGVVVRTDEQRFGPKGRARVAANDIADRIDFCVQAGRAHPVAQLRGRGLMRRREISAGQALGPLRPLCQFSRQIEDPGAEKAGGWRCAGDCVRLIFHHAIRLCGAVRAAMT